MASLPANLKDVPLNEIPIHMMKWEDKIKKVISKNVNADRLLQIAIYLAQSRKELREYSLSSLFGSVIQASMIGLDLSPVLQQAFLIPFKGQITYCLGYRGLAKLSFNSGMVETIFSNVVYRNEVNDSFKYKFDNKIILSHTPMILDAADRGGMVAAYTRIKIVNGEEIILCLPAKDIIETHKNKSQAANSKHSPWKIPEFERFMWMKSVLKELIKTAPFALETQIAKNINVDNAIIDVENFENGELKDYTVDTEKDIDFEGTKEEMKNKVQGIADRLNKSGNENDNGYPTEWEKAWRNRKNDQRVSHFLSLIKDKPDFNIGKLLKKPEITNQNFHQIDLNYQIFTLYHLEYKYQKEEMLE